MEIIVVACLFLAYTSALPFQKGNWHATILSTSTCGDSSSLGVIADLKTKRINEFSSTIVGIVNVTEQLNSPVKIVAFTYTEGSNGNVIKKFSVSYKDVCDTILQEGNIFLEPVFKGSNVPRQCPIPVGTYEWSNVVYDLGGEFRGVVPVGMHRAELRVYSGDHQVLCMRATVELTANRGGK